ncbi:MAG: SOS response-associated peptidase [Leptolyngbya sp. Prado105]|jgi:putative SOS response-associated peptidase YedK|nr:SOS response-associated peptidase [Leptolyngbya sp. Prado105]
MCGRFTQTHSNLDLAERFDLEETPDWQPRYNIAPTQLIFAIVAPHRFKFLYWGLIPSWSKDPTIGSKLINARAETVSEKPSFRTAFKRRRCLIAADGYYEWKKQPDKKQPFYFRLASGDIFAFAGLWEQWDSPTGDRLETCTIITTVANELASPVHDRMPVILNQNDYDRWLDPNFKSAQSLLHPYDAQAMTHYPVSTRVNSPGHESPDCITQSP